MAASLTKNQKLFEQIYTAIKDNFNVLAIKLITDNPDIKNMTFHYRNLLSIACHYGNLEVISYLLENGSVINVGCIHSAIMGNISFENFKIIIDLLISKDVDITSELNGQSPLDYVYKFEKNMDKKLKIIEYLIDKGLTFKNDSILIESVSEPNNLPLVQLLITKGRFNVNAVFEKKISILSVACKTRHNHDIIECLLDHEANTNPISPTPNKPPLFIHMSPLFISVYKKTQEARTVKLLLKHNADINFKTPHRKKYNVLMPDWMDDATPLMAACMEENNIEIIEVLLKVEDIQLDYEPTEVHYQSKATALTNACKLRNNDNVILTLLDNGAKPNPKISTNYYGFIPPLIQAINNGYSHVVVAKFIEKGVNVNLKYLFMCCTTNDLLTDNEDIVEIIRIIITKLKEDEVDINAYFNRGYVWGSENEEITILYGLINIICSIVRNNIEGTQREPVIIGDKLVQIIKLLIDNGAFIQYGITYGKPILELLEDIMNFIDTAVIERSSQEVSTLEFREGARSQKEKTQQIEKIQNEIAPYYKLLEHIQTLLQSFNDKFSIPIAANTFKQSGAFRHPAFDIPRIPETIMCVIICAYRLNEKNFPTTEETEEEETTLEEIIPLELLLYIMSCIEYNQLGRSDPPMIEEIEDGGGGGGGDSGGGGRGGGGERMRRMERTNNLSSSNNGRVGGAKKMKSTEKKSPNIYLTKKYKNLRNFIKNCYKNIKGSNLEEKEKNINKIIEITKKEQDNLKLIVKLDYNMLFDLRYFGELNHKISQYIIKNNILKNNILKNNIPKSVRKVPEKSARRTRKTTGNPGNLEKSARRTRKNRRKPRKISKKNQKKRRKPRKISKNP